MKPNSKADRFLKLMMKKSSFDTKWFFGNETKNPLQFAFDAKRVVHPSVRGRIVPKSDIPSTWNRLKTQPDKISKRAVYIHIPFCQTHCLYCGFFQNFANEELQNAYISRLIKEIEMDSSTPLVSSHPIHAVYIGGGTPSALSAKDIKRLLRTIRTCLPLADDCEFTFEARFYEFDDEKIKACLKGGVNRFSLGVQSFNTKVRRTMRRIESEERVLERLRYLNSLEKAVIIIDLMYGLPYQTMDIWEKDVMTFIKSSVDGGDLYQLIVYEDGRLNDAVKKKKVPPPPKISEQALMFKRGVEIMQKAGYRRLSNCHWARNTKERNLYNQLVRFSSTVIPFGAGAGGNIDGCTFLVDRDVRSYMKRIDAGEKPIMFMMSPPDDYRLYAEIIDGMDLGRLNISALSAKYGIDLKNMLSPLLEAWTKKGLINLNDGLLELTIAGQFWYVNLTQAMLDWLQMMKKQSPLCP